MNIKINDRIIYGIIFLCILCIILVSVLSTGNKEWDWVLGIFSVVGIIASGVYLIRKNKKTATGALDPSLSGSADDKNLDPEIYNQIEKDRDIAIKGDIQHAFVQKFIESDYKELDGEKLDKHVLKTLKTLKTYDTFLSITNNYLNNNNLSIENYFTKILPLFKNTEKYNEDDLKKNIIKYVVFYYLPKYNKVDVVIPLNYKKLVDLYIKDKQIATDRDYEKELNEYIQSKHKEITDPNNFVTKYNNAELKDMQNDLWHYFHKSDGITWTDISNDIILSPYTTDKLKTIYKGLNNVVAKNHFIYNVENLLPEGIDNKDKYIKNLSEDVTSNFIEDVKNNKEDNTELNNKMIKIKNDVDYILQKAEVSRNQSNSINLQALTPYVQNQIRIKHTDLKTEYEKDFLIAYINELLKDVEEKDEIIKYITKPLSYGETFMRN